MLHIFYKIWVAVIVQARSIPSNKYNWKFFTTCLMTTLQALNLMTILMWVNNFTNSNYYDIGINFFYGEKLDNFLRFFILFFLPNLLINYLLIFRNKRYEYLVKKFQPQNISLYIIYVVFTMVFFTTPFLSNWLLGI